MLKTLARLIRGPAVARTPALKATGANQVDKLLAGPIAAVQAGRREEATRLLERLLETHPDLAEAHVLLGTMLHDQKDFENARDHYLLASCFRPEWPVPYLNIGQLAIDQGRFNEAAAPLEKAVALGADNAPVHNAIGVACLHSGNAQGAVESLRRAIALQPDLAEAHSNLGYALFRELEEYEEGTWHIERALHLAPGEVAASCNWIMVLHHRGLTEEALALSDQLLARDPTLAKARMNRALMLLQHGEFGHAWPDYEARKHTTGSACGDDLPWPEWDGSSLAARTIFVYAEQGLGDEIMFASCVPDLIAIAQRCVVECHPKLEKIFRRSFPAAEIVSTAAWRSAPALAQRPPDVKAGIGSLPRFFRRSRDEFPSHRGYLHADPARAGHWKAKLARLPGRRKVGISWRGGVASTRRSMRSVPLEHWVPMLTLPGIDFVSLQYAGAEELDAFRRASGVRVHEWQDAIDDYDETAALVAALDLVVSVQTAIVHLAGALGKRTWALIAATPEWRYGAEGESMPWYPAVRLIRQPRPGEWGPVIACVRDDLQTWSSADAD